MAKFDNCKIKPDILCDVLDYVMDTTDASRKGAAEACSISLSTAGKAIDFFISAKLLSEKQSESTKSGPRPMVVNLNPKYNCAIIDISSDEMKACLKSIDAGSIRDLTRKLDRTIFPDDAITRFLRDFNDYCRFGHPGFRFGAGLILPDETTAVDFYPFFGDREHLSATIGDIVKRELSTTRFINANKRELVARYFASSPIFHDKTVLYLCLNRTNSFSCAVINGSLVRGKNGIGFDMNKILLTKKETVKTALRDDPDTAKNLALLCANAIAYYDPHIIYIDSEYYLTLPGLCMMIKRYLATDFGITNDLPEIVSPDKGRDPLYYHGMVIALKERFREDAEKKIRNMQK